METMEAALFNAKTVTTFVPQYIHELLRNIKLPQGVKIHSFNYETKRYDLFKKIIGNRDTDDIKHIDRIKRKIKVKFIPIPILVNENYEIIDGQHRFIALQQLDMVIVFTIIPGLTLEDVQTLNTNNKNWVGYDFLESYCELGNENYILTKRFMEIYPDLSLSACQRLLALDSIGGNTTTKRKEFKSSNNKSGNIVTNKFHDGTFKIIDFDLSMKLADMIMDLKEHTVIYKEYKFITAFMACASIPEFDFDTFLRKIQITDKIHKCATERQYRQEIERVYNYRTRDKVPMNFITWSIREKLIEKYGQH